MHRLRVFGTGKFSVVWHHAQVPRTIRVSIISLPLSACGALARERPSLGLGFPHL